MANQKKERKLYVYQVLLIILFLIVAIIAAIIGKGAWSRYTTLDHGTSNAEVADWNVNFTPGSNIFTHEYNEVVDERMAPGTSGSVNYRVQSAAEVDFTYWLTLANDSIDALPYNLVLTLSTTDTNNTLPQSTIISKRTRTTADLTGAGFSVAKENAANYDATFTLSWSWAYQTTGTTILTDYTTAGKLNQAELNRIYHDLCEYAFENGRISIPAASDTSAVTIAEITSAITALRGELTGDELSTRDTAIAQVMNDAIDTADTQRLNNTPTNDIHFDVILKATQDTPTEV